MADDRYVLHVVLDRVRDSSIIGRLEAVDNKTEYVRSLIMGDIGCGNDERRKIGRKTIDLTGMTFGKWTVLYRDYERTKPGCTMWKCRCECGNERSVNGQSLRDGKSTQCNECRGKMLSTILGRKKGQFVADPRRRVNGRFTATYQTWDAIIHRCCYPNHKSYKNYGGRGITICEEWKNDYFAFYDYVSKLDRFGEEGMTMDRIDNERGYEPGNVRWATRAEQNRHRRDRNG